MYGSIGSLPPSQIKSKKFAATVFFASVLKYFTCFLGIKYRVRKKSRFIGGPMYFMKRGLSSNLLPVIFCLATICTAVLGGNLVQVNSLTLPMQYFGINPLYGGIFIALIFALVILAGVRTFARVEDLSYVVHLRASDKSKLRSTEIELLLANLQLLLHDINEILNLGKIKFQPWSNAQFCLFPDFRFYCR